MTAARAAFACNQEVKSGRFRREISLGARQARLDTRVIQVSGWQRCAVRGNIRQLELMRAVTFHDEVLARYIAQAGIDDNVAACIAPDDVAPHVQLGIVAALIHE